MRNIMKLLTVLGGGGAFSPSQITGLQRWYQRPTSTMFEEEEGTGAVANGGAVGYLQDLSGNNEHALQATAGDRPLYRSADAVLGDCLDFVSSDLLKWTTAITLQDFSCFFDVVFDTFPLNEPRILAGNSANNNHFIFALDTGSNNLADSIRIQTIGATYSLALSTELALGTRYSVAIRRSGTGANNITYYVNGASVGTASGNNTLTLDQLGARGAKVSVLDGKMKAALIWNVALTDAQMTQVFNFLAA